MTIWRDGIPRRCHPTSNRLFCQVRVSSGSGRERSSIPRHLLRQARSAAPFSVRLAQPSAELPVEQGQPETALARRQESHQRRHGCPGNATMVARSRQGYASCQPFVGAYPRVLQPVGSWLDEITSQGLPCAGPSGRHLGGCQQWRLPLRDATADRAYEQLTNGIGFHELARQH